MTNRREFAFRLAPTLLAGIVALIGVWGCAPKESAVSPETKPATVSHPDVYPIGLKVELGDGSMTLRWAQHGNGTISGYNIFISHEPLLNSAGEFVSTVSPHNAAVYPGDTNPDDNVIEYVAEGLNNGVKYHAAVRVVYPDEAMSRPTNEVIAVCGPRGEFALSVRFKADNDGYSLVADRQVRADASDNDLYFYTKDGEDFLASPSRLDSYQRKSRFTSVSKETSLDDVRRKLSAGQFKNETSDEKISVKAGNWVLLKTSENYSALLHILEISGVNDTRMMRLSYALCPLAGETIF